MTAVRCEDDVLAFGVTVMVRVAPEPLTLTVQRAVFDDCAVTVAVVGDTVAVKVLLVVSAAANDRAVVDSVSDGAAALGIVTVCTLDE